MTGAALVLPLIFSLFVWAFPQLQEPDNASDISKLEGLAEKGEPSAQLALGLAYQNGRGVPQNDAVAVGWYRKAAEAGNSEAQNDLGVMYMNGWGVNKDKQEAVRRYHIAAKQKNAHAMFNLGAAYYNGDGVGIDDVRAFAWFLLAQDRGSASANDAVERAERELGPLAVDSAITEIVEMYFQGDELNRDNKEAIRWLHKVAENGDVHSELLLAGILMNETPPDYSEARQWCEAALKQKSAMAANCLGDIYRNGLGITKDPAMALTLLRQAADSGVVPAMIKTADMLDNGEAGKADPRQALTYLVRAILLGDNDALPRAVAIRGKMSDKEWKKTRNEMMRHSFGERTKLEAILQSVDARSPEK
jgi:uncharacterized protein